MTETAHARLLQAHTVPLVGTHLIEASAGTGKTFNITRLYLRLLLEKQWHVRNILVMTFTRAATAELKGRLADVIAGTLANWGADTDDPFLHYLYGAVPAIKAKSLLRQAMLHMDEAAIYTIHAFCKRALTQQAFVSGISFHADMEAETRDLIRLALEDWYRECSSPVDFAELYRHWCSPADFFREWVGQISDTSPLEVPALPDLAASWLLFQKHWVDEAEVFEKKNVNNRRSASIKATYRQAMNFLTDISTQEWHNGLALAFRDVVPKDIVEKKKADAMPHLARLDEQIKNWWRVNRAHWAQRGIIYARDHLATAKDRLDQLDFNDLIQSLRRHLEAPDTGQSLAEALSHQFPAALVDEFQDTDPDQYAILRALYQHAAERDQMLCMIGDPKQAIYSFRGGDVFAYLQARQDADYQWVMDTNYRSTHGVIKGYNRLFYGAALSEAKGRDVFGFGIEYHPVDTGQKDRRGLDDPLPRGDFQWCLLPMNEAMPGLASRGNGYTKGGMRPLADWCAVEITRLLAEAKRGGEPVLPSDIAILVRDRNEAALMQEVLRNYHLGSVFLSAQDNVFLSPESDSLYRALVGILHLEDDRALVAALATPWLGSDVEHLYRLQNDEQEWARVSSWVAELRDLWFRQGFMKMALNLYQQHLCPDPARHERVLTNGLHLLELLQEAGQRHRQPQALLHWFEQVRTEADDRNGGESRQLRLESDGQLIRMVTLHGSKGLEYPIVFLPFVSYGRDSGRHKPRVVRYHHRRDYHLHVAIEPSEQQLLLYEEEQLAEQIRLLYVGATRGETRVYVMAAEFSSLAGSPLAACCQVGSWQALVQEVDDMVAEGVCRSLVIDAIPAPWPVPDRGTEMEEPEAALFRGRIERDWWLSSFTALTRNLRQGGLSTPDRDSASIDNLEEVFASEAELRFSLQPGAETGNLLHDILETLDFQKPDYTEALDRVAQRYPNLLATEAHWRPRMQSWLEEVLAQVLPGGASLAALPNAATLRETEFYFPMNTAAQQGRLSRILAAHRGAAPIELPVPARLKGSMHGFIDLIYEWEGRYYVVDYKSTHLGNRLDSYRPEALTRNVRQNYYDLQYLLYTLALHRYLRTRLTDYHPSRHLGGVHYLYLRGMGGGSDTGIYHRDIDLVALDALDRFFQGAEESA